MKRPKKAGAAKSEQAHTQPKTQPTRPTRPTRSGTPSSRANRAPLAKKRALHAHVKASSPTSESGPPPSARNVPSASDAPEKPADPIVVAQIRDLEAQLERLIDEASRGDVSSLARDSSSDLDDEVAPVSEPAPTSSSPSSALLEVDSIEAPRPSLPSARPSGPLPEVRSVPPAPESVFDTARELLSTDFYLRKWGRLAMRGRSEEVDDFGYDPIYDEKVRGMLDFLYSTYFRVETSGIENVPGEGRCVLVANHSGTLPLDGVMIKTALKREHAEARPLRWLTEDFIYHFPFVGSMMNRLGAVRACQENAERLLAKEQLVAVFPEGVKGTGKLFAERYRLQRFGRGGFIKLCLRMGAPVIPVAVVGAEETNPMLFRVEFLSKLLKLPYVPVTPTFPLLGPAGLLPAPTKWRILFGEPIDLSSYGAEAADDEILVGKLAERVRAAIQGMLDHAVGARKSVFFG
ncbi:acyltransferase family protein [Labilithrix luteola]|uniref:Acyltransferase family protein n=1 Tax=Labilithrix luteola TaxID=1391654 RepID=A0A0K1Q8P8_9BACT|nr:lysophospholipid acyltransferase family protein [Labilithrix luteola]AKV02181.1 acyltransferase family protein [Labilithrix luteola]